MPPPPGGHCGSIRCLSPSFSASQPSRTSRPLKFVPTVWYALKPRLAGDWVGRCRFQF